MRKRRFNRRVWLNGEPGCNAYVLIDASWNPSSDKDDDEEFDGYLDASVEINLGGRSTQVSSYGGALEPEVILYANQLKALIKTLTEAHDWITKLQDAVRKDQREG